MAITSFGKWTLTPRWPLSTSTSAPSAGGAVDDPGVAHVAGELDPGLRRPRTWRLDFEEEEEGWVHALSIWEQSAYGTLPVDFDVPGVSPTETVQVLIGEKPKLKTEQATATVYRFTTDFEELLHPQVV